MTPGRTRIKPTILSLLWEAALGLIFTFAFLPSYVSADSPQPVDFNREIRPILVENCLSCHGGVKRRADLSFVSRTDALAPTKSGKPALVAGAPDQSELFRRVTHSDPEERMP